MSVLGKICMWEKATRVNNFDGNDVEMLEGVEDYDECIKLGDNPIYSKVIANGKSYNWLLTNIRKRCLLYWGEAGSQTSMDKIRQSILDKLPTGRISKRTAPLPYLCQFRLLWPALDSRHTPMGDDGKWHTRILSSRIPDMFAVTCSMDEVQGTTVGEYFSQRWSSVGAALLDVIQRKVDSDSTRKPLDPGQCESSLQDGTRIAAEKYGPCW
jgi:hypothetical protein